MKRDSMGKTKQIESVKVYYKNGVQQKIVLNEYTDIFEGEITEITEDTDYDETKYVFMVTYKDKTNKTTKSIGWVIEDWLMVDKKFLDNKERFK